MPLRTAIVVGSGPVGCLAAMALAKLGWKVEIYEGRPDIRLPSSKASAQQRSINLAISSRGIAAISAIDPKAADRFLKTVIPMHGRMIHGMDGKQDSQTYDRDGQCINSIDRALLNEDLLEEAISFQGVEVFFRHKVSRVDFEKKNLRVQNLDASEDREIHFDLCVGADGSYSTIRSQLMRTIKMDFQQIYIPHEYIELKMPAGKCADGSPSFLLDPNHLHIWPRHSFMLIALPNKDKTFTCTVFGPTSEFDRLDSPQAILEWFKLYFSDALSIIGEETLIKDFQNNPRSTLITTKSKPYHYKDRAILLGDAAHSMVPFYGQGLNCGLEDVRVLYTLLKEEKVNASNPPPDHGGIDESLHRTLDRYSTTRHEDLVAICDLAMDNYVEMRHAVTTPAYLFKKMLDNILYKMSSSGKAVTATSLGSLLSEVPFAPGEPAGWLPLYTMVTFRPDISYATAKRKFERQAKILVAAGWAGSVLVGGMTVGLAWLAVGHRTFQRN